MREKKRQSERFKDSLITSNTQFYLHSTLYWEVDSRDETYDRLPWGLSLIIGTVFIIIGLSFRIVFLPIRLFFAVVIPIVFIYGCMTGVYQFGWLSFLHWSSVKDTGGVYWMLPVLTVTILIGLAMDYEIFLFSRIFEYRCKGWDTRSAIVLGVSSTGPIISSAGTVMAMAFFGLLLQDIIATDQMGFVFFFGVLIDTFIIRPLLVPAMISWMDWVNWWPLDVPNENLKTIFPEKEDMSKYLLGAYRVLVFAIEMACQVRISNMVNILFL